MEVLVNDRNDIAHVSLVGRLDADGVEEIEQRFAEAATDRGLPTIVDMSGVTFMSSLGIGFLFANTKMLKKAGCKLVLLNPQEMVESVLRTSKMDKVMPIASGLNAALQLLGLAVESLAPEIPSAVATIQPESATAAQKSVPGLKLSIKNEMSELKELYASVAEFLEAHSTPYRSGYTVNLALEELVVNVIRYAYMDFDEHFINIDLSLVDQQLVLVIEDDGRPFDPREGDRQLDYTEDPDDADVGGLGLVLVLDMVDVLKYARVNDRNRTEVRIKFQEAEVPAASQAT